MCCRIVLCALFALWTVTSQSFGQAPSSAESIRVAIKDLEKKLRELEQHQSLEQNNRTTRIGESRISTRPTDENQQVVQLYDLADLFAVTPAYAAMHRSDLSTSSQPLFPVVDSKVGGLSSGGLGSGFGGGGGGFFAVPPKVDGRDSLFQFGGADSSPVALQDGNLAGSRTSLEGLMEAIEATIEPDQWDNAGGSSSMARIGNSLLISATEDMHRQIGELLQLFRKRWGTLRTVSVRAYWLWLTERQLHGLIVQPKRQNQPETHPAVPFGLVAEEAWNKLLTAPIPVEKSQPGNYFAAITGYNGQTVHTLAGDQRSFVTGVTPVVGGGTDVGYGSTTNVVQEGVALQVTPLTSINAKYVVLDVHSRVTRVLDSGVAAHAPNEAAAKTGRAQDAVTALDRPVIANHRLSTTLRVPTEQVLLVGGLSSNVGAAAGSPQLYLFVQVFVQELRDDPVGIATPATKEP